VGPRQTVRTTAESPAAMPPLADALNQPGYNDGHRDEQEEGD
jgi:hypothetical protein